MIAWFARNHVAANLLMASILIAGLTSLSSRISLEVFPSIEIDVVNISVALPGATPEDVERGVAIRIEEAVQDLEGIERLSSRSIEGSTSISIDISSDYNPQKMLEEVKARVDALNTLPPDVERPVIGIAQRKREVISVVVAGDYSEKEIREYAELVRDEITNLPGITQVELDGVRSYEIRIEVSPDRLRQYNLTLRDISNAISANSLDLSAGNIRTDGGDVLIRSRSQSYHRDEFDNIVIKTNENGSIIRLADIAVVHDEFDETPLRSRFNGKTAAMIEVYRIGDQSAIKVAKSVRDYIELKQDSLPHGFKLTYWDDDSQIVKNRLKTLTNSAIQGGVLVFLLLTLFLRPSIAFWVFIGIPISFMGAFIVMPFLGVTLNILSLFGFILVLGIVVDDAIVTGENVYRHLRVTDDGLDAAINGTREVAIPVTFGVLTTIAAFAPLGFIEGHRGALFAQIPAIVIPVLLFSLIESKYVLPAHLKHISLKNTAKQSALSRWQNAFADGFERLILLRYQPILTFCLRHRLATLAVYIGIFIIVLAFVSSGWTRFVFFPRIASETARATLEMPVGTPFEVTDRHVQLMTEAAKKLQEKYYDKSTGESIILDILSSTGSGGRGASGSHVGGVRFEIIPPEKRESDITIRQLVNEWRKLIGPIAGAQSLTFRAEIGRGGDPIDIQLSGNSLRELKDIAEQVKTQLTAYPSVFDISDSLTDGKEELQIELRPEGLVLGLTTNNVIKQVRDAFYGIEVQRIQRGRDDVRVFVRYPIDERNSLQNLQSILIDAPNGRRIPFSHIAQVKPGRSPSAIYRIDRFRTINVTADVNKQKANMKLLQADMATYLDDLTAQYQGVRYSFEGEAKEQRKSFDSMTIGLILVLFVIYLLLAIPFKSYFQPLIVMSVIPFGFIGAVAGHWIMGMDLSIMSLLGLMALVGVVVNDSLVLVDYINKTRQRTTQSLMSAVVNAGAARFRPVMLTSLTTVFGLGPLIFEKSTQAQFLIPMAVSLGFGILFATLITLILVPIIYLLSEDLNQAWHHLLNRPYSNNQEKPTV